jgi:hypothetical protein
VSRIFLCIKLLLKLNYLSINIATALFFDKKSEADSLLCRGRHRPNLQGKAAGSKIMLAKNLKMIRECNVKRDAATQRSKRPQFIDIHRFNDILIDINK